MCTIISKKDMTEEDIKLQYITPALLAKWSIGKITMETKVTDGRINLRGNLVHRETPKHADYLLYLSANNPIAVVEAKDNNHSVSYGLQQAITYAQMLDLPFAYSSNGDGFAEHDFLTGNGHITSWNTCYNQMGLEQSRLWESGTVCLTIAANIGDVSILDFDACFPDSVVGFNAYAPIESNEFLCMV